MAQPNFELVTNGDWLPWWGEQRRGAFRLQNHIVIPGATGVGGYNGSRMQAFTFYYRPISGGPWITKSVPIGDHVVTQPPCAIEYGGQIFAYAYSVSANRPLVCNFNADAPDSAVVNLLWSKSGPVGFPAGSNYMGACIGSNGLPMVWHSCPTPAAAADFGYLWLYRLQSDWSWSTALKIDIGAYTAALYGRSCYVGDKLMMGCMLLEGDFNQPQHSSRPGLLVMDKDPFTPRITPNLTVYDGNGSVDVCRQAVWASGVWGGVVGLATPLPMRLRQAGYVSETVYPYIGSPRLIQWEPVNAAVIGWTGPTWNKIAIRWGQQQFDCDISLPSQVPPNTQHATRDQYGTSSYWLNHTGLAVPHSTDSGRLYYLDLSPALQ